MATVWQDIGKFFSILGKTALAEAPVVEAELVMYDPPLGIMVTGALGLLTGVIAALHKQNPVNPPPTPFIDAQVLSSFQSLMVTINQITGEKWTFDQQALINASQAHQADLAAMAALMATVKKI